MAVTATATRAAEPGAVPLQPWAHPSAWTATEMRARRHEWAHPLSDAELAELLAAADAALASGRPLHELTKEDFPLPTLGPKLDAIRREVLHGRGFALITGVPVNVWTRPQVVAAYLGVGLRWGRLASNNKQGHLVGHIKDIGHDPLSPTTRLYATSAPQPFHNDAADLVSLLCLAPAAQGGTSHWTSSTSVHNAIASTRPDLADVLAHGAWCFDRKGEVPPGKRPFFELPVFNYHAGRLSVNYSDNYFFGSQRHADAPRLTPAHLEAIRVFNGHAASDALRMDYDLQPGDIQLLNNHTCLHARAGFQNAPAPAAARHLLRLWVAPDDAPPLPPAYGELLGGTVEVGRRGGIVCEGTRVHVPLEAE